MVRATDVDGLISLWSATRRGRGGWWALSGFSFQSACYLRRFFEGLSNGAREPHELATIERLADVLVPGHERDIVIQAKRTLDRTRLKDALREAYEIAKLAAPNLLASLRFQIACLKRQCTETPRDFSVDQIVDGGDSTLWSAVLDAFDEEDPIIEEPDPFDQLHDVLWHAGIQDTPNFVDGSLGTILRRFLRPDREVPAEIARDLARAFFAARGRSDRIPKRVGLLLRREDIGVDTTAAESDRKVVVDRRPQLEDLRLLRFRSRPLFDDLKRCFDEWWADVVTESELSRIPIFWIDGRSGEGKSVLLLQLVQQIVTGPAAPVASFMRLPDDLPDWIESQSRMQHAAGQFELPALAVVDDLHLLRERDAWKSDVEAAGTLIPPRIAVLASGPTPERMRFEDDFRHLFDVTSFTVPNLDVSESQAFAAWYGERTGKSVLLDAADVANRMLVIWLFELTHGVRLADFAHSFEQRLRSNGVFDVARRVLATNALELPAPRCLIDDLADDAQRDAFITLCDQAQLHFELVGSDRERYAGYRLAHPQIDWLLYGSWTGEGMRGLEWARDLAYTISVAARHGEIAWCRQVITDFGSTTKLSGDGQDASLASDRALAEMYRKVHATLGEQERIPLLGRWLAQCFRHPNAALHPDPVDDVLKVVSVGAVPPEFPAVAATWLWRLSAIERHLARGPELRAAVERIVMGIPNENIGGIANSIGAIVSSGVESDDAINLAHRWLRKFAHHEDSHPILVALAHRGDRDEVRQAAHVWLWTTRTNARAANVFGALLAILPGDRAILDAALVWLDANTERGYEVLTPLLVAQPNDLRIYCRAIEWAECNTENQHAYWMLITLVSRRPNDVAVMRVVWNWLRANPTHKTGYALLSAVIHGRPNDIDVVEAVWQQLRGDLQLNQRVHLFTSAISARPNDAALITAAVEFIDREGNGPGMLHLLPSLVKWSDDPQVLRLARESLAANFEHVSIFVLLAALIRYRPDRDVVAIAEQRLVAGVSSHGTRELLVAMATSGALDQDLRNDMAGVIVRWLGANRGAPEYAEVLRVCRKRRTCWDALVRAGLDDAVIRDAS